jgi:hypothetical protein
MQNKSTNAPILANPCYRMPKFIPMLFSTPMVQAIQNGTKTQTRRIIKPQPKQSDVSKVGGINQYQIFKPNQCEQIDKKINVGDIIWVRETFSEGTDKIIYRSNVCSKWDLPDNCKWKPSLFMPKSACKYFLEVSNVRIERLNNISNNDSINEGLEWKESQAFKDLFGYEKAYKDYMKDVTMYLKSPIESYKSLWNKINGIGSWDKNPFVWVYTFKLLSDVPDGFR